MAHTTYRKCRNCGEVSLNKDYCPVCGTIVNIKLKKDLERKERAEQREATKDATKEKSSFTLFLENAKNNDNIFIRFFARFFYTTWVIVLAVGGFLALVFGYIAA